MMTDIREKIKVRMVADRRQRGYAFFDMWAERVAKLTEAIENSIARSEKYCDLHCCKHICQALEAFERELEG